MKKKKTLLIECFIAIVFILTFFLTRNNLNMFWIIITPLLIGQILFLKK